MLTELLSSISDVGRDIWRGTLRSDRGIAGSDLDSLCRQLLSSLGEASGTALARAVVDAARPLDHDGRVEFFDLLLTDFGSDMDTVQAGAGAFLETPSQSNLVELTRIAEAPRQELFRRMNLAPRGTETLVSLRRDLIGLLPGHPRLEPVAYDLGHVLASWFNPGFLRLERINWQTPANILEKLIAYESVHEMDGWNDLKRRLAADRRCFAFFHPALPEEPIIFVEVALVDGMASAIQPLLDRQTSPEDTVPANTAIFYSISNCQDGLKGISFGNFLIKQVVDELSRDLPQIRTFATLSPVPGLCHWLASAVDAGGPDGATAEDVTHLVRLRRAGWRVDATAPTAPAERELLTRLCCRYLAREKRGTYPADPVARFHLGNGARLERVNWLGDRSSKGVAESAGILVNYLYDRNSIERNHEAYVRGTVNCSPAISRLL
jgi:malonyl-CoA decarboxylase